MMLVQPGRVKTQSLLASPEEVRSQTSHGPDGFDNYCYNINDNTIIIQIITISLLWWYAGDNNDVMVMIWWWPGGDIEGRGPTDHTSNESLQRRLIICKIVKIDHYRHHRDHHDHHQTRGHTPAKLTTAQATKSLLTFASLSFVSNMMIMIFDIILTIMIMMATTSLFLFASPSFVSQIMEMMTSMWSTWWRSCWSW